MQKRIPAVLVFVILFRVRTGNVKLWTESFSRSKNFSVWKRITTGLIVRTVSMLPGGRGLMDRVVYGVTIMYTQSMKPNTTVSLTSMIT